MEHELISCSVFRFVITMNIYRRATNCQLVEIQDLIRTLRLVAFVLVIIAASAVLRPRPPFCLCFIPNPSSAVNVMSPAFSPKGPPPGHGGALRLDCVIVCRPPVWHNQDKQMIRGFRGESEVQIPIPAPQWLLTNKQYGKLRGAFRYTALDNFDANMQIEAYDTSKIPSNWNNLWLDVTSTCHPSQLTWKDVEFREDAPGNPTDAGEQSDEAPEGQVSVEEYEAPLILVRDGLYAP